MLVNTEPSQENLLQKRLEDIFKTRAERIMFVKGDPDIEYQMGGRRWSISDTAPAWIRSV